MIEQILILRVEKKKIVFIPCPYVAKMTDIKSIDRWSLLSMQKNEGGCD